MKIVSCLVAAVAAFANVSSAFADVPIRPEAELLREGYRAAPAPGLTPLRFMLRDELETDLPWPVQFPDDAHTLGNSMLQFQQYWGTLPYYHGGCDLRTAEQGPVTAPTSGRLEAGHYSYTQQPDGSTKKYWKPWPQTGEALYFEVAIIDDAGYRFELHHVDRDTLTPALVAALNSGNGRIERGAAIGRSVYWPSPGVDGELYHHVHYNIYSADGTHLNPEHHSAALADDVAPTIHAVYGIATNGRVTTVAATAGQIDVTGLKELVVATTDRKSNGVYTQPPVRIEAVGDDGGATGWDFRRTLERPLGGFPALFDVYRAELTTPDGRNLRTRGDYDNNYFLFRVPVTGNGRVRLLVADQAGNTATLGSP